ncbi:MAG TPA: response regulator transcription factor [Longimicrobiales bacterium]|nr:response regulator transcription factor [Longimicrobiales bacterium]
MSEILLVEDNPDLAYGLRNNLEIEGYDVTVAADGEVGLQRALELDPSLVILDLMLPKLDGYRVLRAIREAGSQVPVLILTAKGEEADKVLGFRMGADDYVTKPFGVLELLARVRAVLRRTRNGNGMGYPADGDRFGDVDVDTRARTVLKAGESVSLTPKEFDLLVALLRRQGAVASRLELMKEVWGHRAAVVSRTVDTHVAELRRKLEDDASKPRHILTVWKAGYRLER